MINREDMLELTRRMTLSRSSITRIAGCYMDSEGFIDGTFNTNFLKLSAKDKQTNLAIAKTIPFSDTNGNLRDYSFTNQNKKQADMWRLLAEMKSCGLKNDALMDTFYDLVAEKYQTKKDYTILVFHDCYDVPVKASDKVRVGESEEVFEYLIGAVCPLVGDYEPGEPEFGFLYPMFSERSSDINHIGIYQKDKNCPHEEMEELFSIVNL